MNPIISIFVKLRRSIVWAIGYLIVSIASIALLGFLSLGSWKAVQCAAAGKSLCLEQVGDPPACPVGKSVPLKVRITCLEPNGVSVVGYEHACSCLAVEKGELPFSLGFTESKVINVSMSVSDSIQPMVSKTLSLFLEGRADAERLVVFALCEESNGTTDMRRETEDEELVPVPIEETSN